MLLSINHITPEYLTRYRNENKKLCTNIVPFVYLVCMYIRIVPILMLYLIIFVVTHSKSVPRDNSA